MDAWRGHLLLHKLLQRQKSVTYRKKNTRLDKYKMQYNKGIEVIISIHIS